MSLSSALFLDLFLGIWSTWVLVHWTERSVFNPGFWYLGLHAFVVTFRLNALYAGSQLLNVSGVRSESEVIRAALASDISLVAVAIASVWAAIRANRGSSRGAPALRPARLNPFVGQVISILCLTMGTAALAFYISAERGTADAMENAMGDFSTTSYPLAIAGFAVQGAVILCVLRGFTPWRIVILLVLLGWTAITLFRMSFVIPSILAMLIHLTMHRKRTISLRWALALLGLGLLWYVGKPVAMAARSGEGFNGVWDAGKGYFQDSMNSGGNDVQLLDLQASFMAASDEQGRRFYGTTILPLMYLPVPRFMWPNKPAINQFAVELSSASRAFSRNGMTPNLTGESYLNFGWWGCVIIPFLYLYGMQAAFLRVRNQGIGSAPRWLYMVMLVIMVQVFRDGMNSLVLYPLVDFLPLFGWGAASMLLASNENGIRHIGRGLPIAMSVRRSYR